LNPAGTTQVDFAQLTAYQRYKLMASLIVPRPIALVTTLGANGVVNAAPFSMFNMVGEDPPIVMISLNKHADGGLKDTAANILASGEFVVHLADEAIAEQMHACGASLPPDQSEVELVGFTTRPSNAIRPPRIAEAPVAFECRLLQRLELGRVPYHVIIGEVLYYHFHDGIVDEKFHIDVGRIDPIGRLAGKGGYTRITDRFEMPRLKYGGGVVEG
jgi:flavin reductase (DIM6/NTAB) family NADH-FMN oxidoreductase RutF